MTKYNVITKSGADYVLDFDNWFWQHRGGAWEKMGGFYVSNRSNIHNHELLIPWEQGGKDMWIEAEGPVMGRRMHLQAFDGRWRISTDVVAIEVVEDE